MPDYFEWRIESRAPNGFQKFPFGDPRNYVSSDAHIKALSSFKVDQYGNCLEASIEALVDDLPDKHLSSANICSISIRNADQGDWTDVYAGVVTSPGAPNDYEPSTITMLGIKKRLYETVVPPKFGVLTSHTPWIVDNNQDGRTGDVGQVIRNLIAAISGQLGGPETTLAQDLSLITIGSAFSVTIDPNFNSAGELIDKILETMPNINGLKAVWGVTGARRVFVTLQSSSAATAILPVNDSDPGTFVKWQTVDSSKIVSAVRWVGFSIDRDAWVSKYLGSYIPSLELQNFVTHQSQGDQSFGFVATRENIPEGTITGLATQMSVSPSTNDAFGNFNYVVLPATFPLVGSDVRVRCKSKISSGPAVATPVDGVRIRIESRGGASPGSLIVYRSSGDYSSGMALKEGDHDYWFSNHLSYNPANDQQIFVEAVFSGPQPSGAEVVVYEMYLLQLWTYNLDLLAESRYRFPVPEAATVTVDGLILQATPFVEITWAIADGSTRSVTRAAQSYEYKITPEGYPVTVIQVGQARDANETAIWAEIKGRDRQATNNANSYAARGR